jgi:hypothetical protein
MRYDAHVGSLKVFSSDAADGKSALKAAKEMNPKVTHVNLPKSKPTKK